MILSDPRELAHLQGQQKFRGPGSVDKNAQLDQSKKEVGDFIAKVRSNLDASWRATEQWRIAAEESYRFVENDMWDEKDKGYLISKRRPVLTFNRILAIVRLLSGLERQNKQDMKVFPRKGANVDSANMMDELVRFVDDENLGQFQRVRKSNDVYVTGRGFIISDLSYDENILGDVVFKRRNPLSCFIDPMSEEWDGSDWRWCGNGEWLVEDEAKELWPEFEDQIKYGEWFSPRGGSARADLMGDRLENEKLFVDATSKRVRIFDYWYRKREIVEIAVNKSTGDVRVADEKFKAMLPQLAPEEQAKIGIIRRPMSSIRVATIMNWLLLQDKPSPFEHGQFPIIPYIGIQYFREPWGIVEYLKDPARLKNKSISQAMNHLNRSASSGFYNHVTEGVDPKVLEEFGSMAGINLNYKSVKPEPIEPVQLSAGHAALVNISDEEVKEISSVNADLLGLGSQRTISGKAIEARKNSGATGNEDFFDNQLLGDKILGTQLIALIQQVFTPERIMDIVDNLTVQNPNSPIAAILTDAEKAAHLPDIISMVLKGEHAYIVDKGPASITARQEMFDKLMQAAEKFPGAIPGDVLVDASDFPDNIKARIKENIMAQQQQAAAMAAAGGPAGPSGPMAGRRRPESAQQNLQ